MKEFQVITNNYSAEYQSKPGAIVSAVTKSGSNSFHGSLFEFLRNDNLDAAQWELAARGGCWPNCAKSEFRRNQFGGSVGGPIFRDRTFFFGSYEGLREAEGQTLTMTLPSADGRRGILGGDLGGPTEVNPIVVPYLNLLPVPGEGNTALVKDFGNGLAQAAGPRNQLLDSDYGAIKGDHQFASQRKGFLAFTWNADNSARRRIDPIQGARDGSAEESGKRVYSLRHTSILNPTTLNEFVFGFIRSSPADSIPVNEPDWKNMNGVDVRFSQLRDRMGELNMGQDIVLVGYPRDRNLYQQDFYTFRDSLSLSRTDHTLKLGAEINPIRYVMDQVGGSYNGVYQFQEFRRFLRGDVEQLEHDLPSGVRLPNGQVVEAVKIFYFHQKQMAFYFQDNWKVRPSLTLNLGLRYEFLTDAEEDNGKIANLRHFTDPSTTIGINFQNPTKRNFSPRFGFAWSPGGTNRSAVRGGFGIYYELPNMNYWRSHTQEMVPFAVAGFLNKADAIRFGQAGVEFPRGLESQTQLLAQVPSFRMWEYENHPTYVYRWSLSLERQMGNWFGSIAYNGSRGVHLYTQSDANQAKWIGYPANPTPGLGELQWAPVRAGTIGEAINPAFANMWVLSTRGNSFYHGLTLNVQRRMAAGLQFQAGYNFSRNIDYGAGSSGIADRLPQGQRLDYYWQHGRRKGLSLLSIKHNFVTNFTWELPRTSLTGVLGTIVNGWQTNGVLTLNSGTPFSVFDQRNRAQLEAMRRIGQHRPNLIANGNNNPITGNPDRWFDPEQFVPSTCRAGVYCYTSDARGRLVGNPSLGYQVGFLGNLGSNTVIGPRQANFDFSLSKNIPITETMRFQFRSEFFNLFNTPNFRIPANEGVRLFTSSGARDPRGGRIDTTETSPRQIQFALKFIF